MNPWLGLLLPSITEAHMLRDGRDLESCVCLIHTLSPSRGGSTLMQQFHRLPGFLIQYEAFCRGRSTKSSANGGFCVGLSQTDADFQDGRRIGAAYGDSADHKMNSYRSKPRTTDSDAAAESLGHYRTSNMLDYVIASVGAVAITKPKANISTTPSESDSCCYLMCYQSGPVLTWSRMCNPHNCILVSEACARTRLSYPSRHLLFSQLLSFHASLHMACNFVREWNNLLSMMHHLGNCISLPIHDAPQGIHSKRPHSGSKLGIHFF